MNSHPAITTLAEATWAAYQNYAPAENVAGGTTGLVRYWLGVSHYLTSEINRLEEAVLDLYENADPVGSSGFGQWGTAAAHLDVYKLVRHQVTRHLERLDVPQSLEDGGGAP
uniref:hypothetical protein n=1 Tax=Nonomuraea sp. CA-251285 TaxID=3240002 RepID=UPI003F496A71